MAKNDSIRDGYFKPLEVAEFWADVLFWLTSLLSFGVLFIDPASSQKLYAFAQGLMVILVVVGFVLGNVIRLYLIPRALHVRQQDLIGNSYGVAIARDHAESYYTNLCPLGIKRLAANLFENSLFSMRISLGMLRWERARLLLYLVLFLVTMRLTDADPSFVVIVAVFVFSEQLVARWIRLEWFRNQCERTYEMLHSLFLDMPSDAVFSARTIVAFGCYESAKSLCGVTLSEKVFDRINDVVSTEWERTKSQLNIGSQ